MISSEELAKIKTGTILSVNWFDDIYICRTIEPTDSDDDVLCETVFEDRECMVFTIHRTDIKGNFSTNIDELIKL